MAQKNELSVEDLLSESMNEKQIQQQTFEASMKVLEELVAEVESGELPLEKAVRAHEQGMILVKHMQTLLEGAESKLRVLKLDDLKDE